MTPDRRQALEQAGFTVGNVDQFLGSIQTGAVMAETTTGGIKVVDPKVRIIGQTEVDVKEMEEFILDEYGEVLSPYSEDAPSAGDALAEFSGRVCYMSFKNKRPGGNQVYLDHIKEVGHGSIAEHSNYSLLFTGVSRSLTHELIRHRAGMAYSQASQRYIDESVAEYVEPDIIRDDPELHEIWLKAVQHAHEAYVDLADRLTEKLKRPDGGAMMIRKETVSCSECDGTGYLLGHTDGDEACPGCLGAGRWDITTFVPKGCPKCGKVLSQRAIDVDGKFVQAIVCIDRDGGKCDYTKPLMTGTERRKAARQAARSVLPNATETKIVVTGNARAWRHFLEQRGSRHAEPEIRKLANIVLTKLQAAAPNLFSDYVMDPLDDGTSEINTKYRKV